FSSPATMRSTACVKSSCETASPPRRVARSAASLIRLARSAPENPGVSAATCSRSTPLARRTLRACTCRIASRPRLSGRSTSTCRSKRPARSQAPVLLRVLEELDHLLELGLRLIHAGDVGEGDAGLVLDVDLGAALADAHEAAAEALAHAPREEVPDGEEHQRRHDPGKEVAHEVALMHAGVLDVVLPELLGELRLDAVGDRHGLAALW